MEEGERAMTTSLMAITVGPPPAAVITIAIDGAAIGRTDLSPPMTAVAIIAIVVTTITVDGAVDWGGRWSDRSDSPHNVLQKMLQLIFQL